MSFENETMTFENALIKPETSILTFAIGIDLSDTQILPMRTLSMTLPTQKMKLSIQKMRYFIEKYNSETDT
jgi:hypothetical protein